MIKESPKDMESVTEHKICDYHKKHPEDKDYAGCTCSGSWTYQKKGD